MLLRSHRLKQDFELSKGTLLIGRLENCHIALSSASVSKRHLEIQYDGSKVQVCDLNSRNGSRINDARIEPSVWLALHPNDCLDVCGYDFRLIDENGPGGSSGSCMITPSESDSALSGTGSRSISLSKSDFEGGRPFSQLRALLAITRTLHDVLHIEDVLQRAVSMLFEIIPAIDRAAIGFVDDDRQFTPKWWQLRDADPESVIRISQTIVNHVTETSEAVTTSDAMADFGEARSVHALSMRSVMCAPLIDAEESVFGLIHVDASRPNLFAELDLEVLAAVAMQISLAINFSQLHAAAVEDAIVRREIEQAREVQQRYIPDSAPPIAGYDLAGFYRAARHVGGDYIDYIPLERGQLALVLGDVVGKGVPAALTMVRLATETRASFEAHCDPRDIACRLNQRFAGDFVTMVVLIVDPTSHTVTIANAGHEPPLLRTADGNVTSIGNEMSGYPLGVDENESYNELVVHLQPGERLIFFSDGFPDAEHTPSGRRFGSQPITECLEEFDGSNEEFVDTLVTRVDRFADGSAQFDDMCMVCLRRLDSAVS